MRKLIMRIVALATVACCVLLMPSQAQAYSHDWRNGNEVWNFDVFQNDDGELEATINGYYRVDSNGTQIVLPDSLTFNVPATVPVAWTNEFGHMENVFDGGTYVSNKFVTTSGPEAGSAIVKVTGVALDWGADTGKVVRAIFPDSVTWVSGFRGCVNLAEVEISDDAEFSGGAFICSPWLKGLGEFAIRNDVLVAYQGTATDVTVPDGVVAIGDYAFSAYDFNSFVSFNEDMTNLTTVTLPASVEEIGGFAFSGCGKLSSINIHDSVTYIGGYAFDWCESLATVTLPVCLEYLGHYAFRGTAITEIAIPDRIESLQGGTFSDCANLTTVTFRGPLQAIGDYEFDNCPNLASINLPASLKRIGDCAFNGSALTEVALPDSLECINYGAFVNCTNLATVTGGANVKEVWQDAFYNTKLYNDVTDDIVQAGLLVVGYNGTLPAALVIPDGVTCIAYGVFACNTDITSVEFPASLHTIGYEAFGHCSNLATVTGGLGIQRMDENVFCDTPYEKTLTIDCDRSDVPFDFVRLGGVVLSYKGVCPSEIVIPNDVTQVYEDVFDGSEHATPANITSVTIGSGVRSIGPCAFCELANLATVTGGGAVADIDYSFAYCPKLTDFSIAGPLLRIDPSAFIGDYSLANFALELTELEDENDFFFDTGWLQDCDKLASVKVTFPGYTLDGWEARADAPSWMMLADELPTYRFMYKYWFGTGDDDWFPAQISLRALWNGGKQPIEPEEPTPPVVTPPVVTPEPMPTLWGNAPDGQSEAVEGQVPEDAASVYDGFLMDASGNVAGTVQAKVSKAKNGTAKITVSVVPAKGKKTSVKGTLDIATGKVSGMDLELGANGMVGTWSGYTIAGSRNLFSSKTEQTAAKDMLKQWLGPVNVAWKDSKAASAPYQSLTVTVANKGKVKVAGMLASGTKVSASGQLVIGEEWLCVPVVWSKRSESVAFTLWLAKAGGKVMVDLDDAVAGKPSALKGGSKFNLDSAAIAGMVKGVETKYLPDGLEVSGGTKWSVAKAGSVAYKNGAFDETKAGGNPSGLKLSHKAKDGTFKGSFTAYAVQGGKMKKTKIEVNGVVVDGVGYGAAMIKKAGSVAVTVE